MRYHHCQTAPPNKWQKFYIGDERDFVEYTGMITKSFEIRSSVSDLCVDIDGHDGVGAFYLSMCEKTKDQFFFFRNRGKILH